MRWFASLTVVASILALSSAAAAQRGVPAAQILSGLEGKYYLAGAPRIPHTLTERMRAYHVPGASIAVIDDYRVVWKYAAGLRDVAAAEPVTTATLFQAASMSKPVAAAGILRQFEQRHLSLDADVNTLLRSWHLAMPANSTQLVTMRRLLSHSAGINVHGFAGYDRDAQLPSLLQVLNGAPPANSPVIRVTGVPGSKTEYSGGGTSIAQQVAVDVSGEPFAPFTQQTLLGPLGMRNSTFDQPLPEVLWTRAADGYYGNGKPVHRGWHVYPTMAAAGLWTTPADLATFVIAVQNALRGRGEPPIDATVAREMATRASQGFGLGLGVAAGYFAHNGANEGFQGNFYRPRFGRAGRRRDDELRKRDLAGGRGRAFGCEGVPLARDAVGAKKDDSADDGDDARRCGDICGEARRRTLDAEGDDRAERRRAGTLLTDVAR